MNKYMIALIIIGLLGITACSKKTVKTEKEDAKTTKLSFYDLNATDINGQKISMRKYKGKTILIVNTASKCGYTGQYKQLEELYKKYSNQLVILGFPTNDFFGQEPGSNKDIAEFCTRKFNVTFPMFAKITVKGKDISPIYKWLTDPTQNGWNKKKPSWNFNKYVIDKDGNLIKHFGSGESPLSAKIVSLIK
jgi:glutathione peroxidase